MDTNPQTTDASTQTASPRGKERLQRLKAQVFEPQTKDERSERALAALQQAIKPTRLDAATLKYIAQHADLEGS